MANFEADTLEALRATERIAIRDKHPDKAVPIWVVVAGDKVFVRSVYGTPGRWYRDLADGGPAVLAIAGQEMPVQAIPEGGAPAVAAASAAYLQKYGSSSYAQAMVQPEVLAHTLRLEPR
jgi:hypothetical protein